MSYNFIIFTIPIFEFLTITYPVISAELGYSPVFEIKNKYKLQNKTYDLPESHSIISKQARVIIASARDVMLIRRTTTGPSPKPLLHDDFEAKM